MHFSKQVSSLVLLLSLWTEPGYSYSSQDAFGVTNHGYRCGDEVYLKFDLFAAAKRFCDIAYQKPALRSRLRSFFGSGNQNKQFAEPFSNVIEYLKPSFFQLPILLDGSFYPFEIPPELRLAKNADGNMVKIDPGPVRLILDRNCDIQGAYRDFGYRSDMPRGGGVEQCELLTSLDDLYSSSTTGYSSSENNDSPFSSPRRRSPRRSPARSLKKSSKPHKTDDIEKPLLT